MLKSALLTLSLLCSGNLLAQAADLTAEIKTVEALRGIRFLRTVQQKTISRQEFRSFLKTQIDMNLPVPVDDYFSVLRALHLLGDEPEPLKKLFDLYEAQVVAFYDPRTHIYYSLDKPPVLADQSMVPKSAVVVHELMHALQDQHFGAWGIMEKRKLDWDSELAYQAVLEGEATLVMMAAMFDSMDISFDGVIREDSMLQLLSDPKQFQVGIPADAPPYFVSSMIFPYIEGVKFVIQVYRRGGWKAVDSLHRKPPINTEEVLHPELYFARVGSGEPARLPSGGLINTHLGEFHWKYLLDEEAASGWASDDVRVMKGADGKMTVFIDSSWDSEKDAVEFSSAIATLLRKKGAAPSVKTRGKRVLVAYGQDRNAVRKFVR